MKVLHKKALVIEEEAKGVFRAHDRHSNEGNTYLESFVIRKVGRSYHVVNTARHAFWVEFGSHIYPHGSKNAERTFVLGYAPLRTAVDIVSSYS